MADPNLIVPAGGGPQITPGQQNMLSPALKPPVTGHGHGTVAVNTEAMLIFSDNIGQLHSMLDDAISVLRGLRKTQAGCFFEAYTINRRVNSAEHGNASTQNLVDEYTAVLRDCKHGLGDLQLVTQKIAQKYTKADELNNIKITDLNNYLAPITKDFDGMMNANGASGM